MLQVPIYIVAQMLGSILASVTLYRLFDVTGEAYFGTVPVGPHCRSLIIEIIISYLLMFVISGVATDNRAVSNLLYLFFSFNFIQINLFRPALASFNFEHEIRNGYGFILQVGELAGFAVGMTIVLNVFVAG